MEQCIICLEEIEVRKCATCSACCCRSCRKWIIEENHNKCVQCSEPFIDKAIVEIALIIEEQLARNRKDYLYVVIILGCLISWIVMIILLC
jgi:hypothetical protein